MNKIQENKLYDIIVIGGGPAAVSSAIYASRKGASVGLIAENIGGQVLTTNDIENIIGISKTTGAEYADSLEQHLNNTDVEIYLGHKVVEIKDAEIKQVITDDKKVISSKAVIIATGAKHKHLNIPGEKEYAGKGVHYCSTCDGPFYRNLDVCIVGGGNAGVEAAKDMSKIAKNVTLFEYMPKLSADMVLQKDLYANEKIKIITNAKVEKVEGSQYVTSLTYTDRATNEQKVVNTDAMFVEIGLIPNTDIFKDLLKLNKIGEIEINNLNETSIKGIFAAGDCTTVAYKQIVISVGEGAKAALSAFNYISKI